MSINIEKLINLNDSASLTKKRKYVIILDPDEKVDENKKTKEKFEQEEIMFDKAKWKLPKELNNHINELKNNNDLNDEEKILKVFEKICTEYVYDDNLISYIKRVGDNKFELPDWYGREVGEEWEENREIHNKRICFELSRYLAKSLSELFKDKEDFNVCIHWDKDLVHYFVGISSDDYDAILDVDDFYEIKDLTRAKTGLTIEGIKVLRDYKNKFTTALEKFNKNREKDAMKNIESEIYKKENNSDDISSNSEEIDDLDFIKNALDVLVENNDLDSQGIFEYIKEIVDIKLGSDKREKIWKKRGKDEVIRCLVVEINNEKYLIDGDERTMFKFNPEEEFKEENNASPYLPYKSVKRGELDFYDGS